jgi:hypothetical protein
MSLDWVYKREKKILILSKNFREITFFASSETPISVIKKFGNCSL